MAEDTIFLQDAEDLMGRLNKLFDNLGPDALREVTFFLREFHKRYPMPKDTVIYVTELPVVSLEVTSHRLITDAMVGGIEKYTELQMKKKTLPPVIVVKGGIRNIIVYGEPFAVEAYVRDVPLRAIVYDVGDRNPFEVLSLGDWESAFVTPLVDKKVQELEQKK